MDEAPRIGAFLDDVLVLEVGSRRAVGAAGGLLARLGATVIALETGAWRGDERSGRLAGKQSLTLDPAIASDRVMREGLLRRADIVLLSSDVDMDGIWDAARPRMQIVCDITAYGRRCPLSGIGDSDALVQARCGAVDTMGQRDGPPSLIGAPLLDMEAAVYATAAILAARRAAASAGLGQRIDMALYDVGVNALLTFLPLSFIGRPATRNGNRHPTLSPWNSYRASDGWVLICAPTNDQWRRLCEVMERIDLVIDPRYATTTARMDNVEAIDLEIGGWTTTMTVADTVAKVGSAGVPCGPIVDIADLAADPNLRRRLAVLELRDDQIQATALVAGALVRTEEGIERAPAAIAVVDDARPSLARLFDARPASADLIEGDPGVPGLPLDGVRLIEIGMNTVAPLAGRQFGALGADVIKIEPPSGDSNRANAPLREDGQSFVFALSNTDKRGLVLDLKSPDDRERLFALLPTANAVLENLKPGSLGKLGVGANDIRAACPNLIHCSVSGFGHDSVFPGRPALDTVIQGMSGVMTASMVDGVPTKAGISISDQLGGQFALVALLAALERQERTGAGCTIDLAMQDCSAWATHALWNRGIGDHEAEVLACCDGWIVVESRLSDPVGCSWPLDQLTRDEAVAHLMAAGLAVAPVLSVDEVLASRQTQARGLLLECPTADGSRWTVLGSPLKLLGSPAHTRSVMPRLGHTDPSIEAKHAGTRCAAPGIRCEASAHG